MNLKQLNIQEYISLAYLYLLALGVCNDIIYYKFIGINILNYAPISDLLLTPIAIITHNIKVGIAFSIIIAIAYWTIISFSPWFHHTFKTYSWYKKTTDIEKADIYFANIQSDIHKNIQLVALFTFFTFVGFGIGRGNKIANKIQQQTLSLSHQIIFTSKDTANVSVVGQNSSYLFYVMPEDSTISISPIMPNIKVIKKLAKQEQEEEEEK